MTAKSDAWEDDLLVLVFHNIAGGIFTSLNVTAGAASDVHLALHDADPLEAGLQNANELGVGYAAYGRIAVNRLIGEWPKQGNNGVDNANVKSFGQRTETTAAPVASHVSIGVANTGATEIIYFGPLDTNLTINQNVNPTFAVGALVVQEN